MNKYPKAIRKLGAILQPKNATKDEVKKAYKNFVFLSPKDVLQMDEYIDPITPIINAMCKDFATQFDGQVMKAVQEVGIVVDKDRLVQALTDAHRFYEEGYIAGSNYVHRHGRWIVDGYFNYASCSCCGKYAPHKEYDIEEPLLSRYCPHCGTKMDGKDGAE